MSPEVGSARTLSRASAAAIRAAVFPTRFPRLLLSTLFCTSLWACGPASVEVDEDDEALEVTEAGLSVPTVEAVNDGAVGGALVSLIATARTRVDLLAFEYVFTDAPLRPINDALAAAVRRGVQVRVLLDDGVPANVTAVPRLKALGIDAKLDATTRTTHNKLVLVDGRAFLAGSTNLSTSSLTRNHETDVVVRLASVAASLQPYVDALWRSSGTAATVAPTSSRVVTVLGDAQYAPVARGLIDGAKKRVELVMYAARYANGTSVRDGLVDALLAAHRRGVAVRVVLERAASGGSVSTENAAVGAHLTQGGVTVRYESPTQVTHAKLLLVDDVAVTGSTNWTTASLADYHATDVLVRRATVTASFRTWFDALWAASTP